MNLMKTNLTSNLDFYLTKKRFQMMHSPESLWKSIPRIFATIYAISFLALLFCSDVNDTSYSVTSEKLWPMLSPSYSDITLNKKSLFAEGDSITSLTQIPYKAFTEKGEPFSGVENVFSERTDILTSSNVYVDGFMVHTKVFDSKGLERASVDKLYNPQKTKLFSHRYYEYGTLVNEIIFSSPDHDGKQVYKQWHPNGQLSVVMIYDSSTGSLINYDLEGNEILHERYEGDELMEKIK